MIRWLETVLELDPSAVSLLRRRSSMVSPVPGRQRELFDFVLREFGPPDRRGLDAHSAIMAKPASATPSGAAYAMQ